jgi:hypothetical protein
MISFTNRLNGCLVLDGRRLKSMHTCLQNVVNISKLQPPVLHKLSSVSRDYSGSTNTVTQVPAIRVFELQHLATDTKI